MASSTVVEVDIRDSLPKVASGKVRDLFAVDEQTLLFIASDRISAYDVVMENVRKLEPRGTTCFSRADWIKPNLVLM
jgi:hypothetical protein